MYSDANLKSIWKEGLTIWRETWVRVWPWLLFSMIIEELTSYGANRLEEVDERLKIMAVTFVIMTQLVLSAFGVIIINQAIQNIRLKRKAGILDGLQQNIKYVFIESTRALLPIILKTLLFVVPGIIEGIKLYFVPYVAQFDLAYKQGQVDALEKSRELCRGRFWTLSGILLLTVVLSMVPRLLLDSLKPLVQPALYLGVFFICMVVELYTDIVLFSTYWRLNHGLEVSRQRPS